MKILIIDDEPSLLKLLEISLKSPEREIYTADQGKKGLEIFDSEIFDVVLCDIGLGDMDGIEVLKQLKQRQAHIPVIMITAHGSVETAIKAMKLGAYDYVQKPFEPEEIGFVIERACRESNLLKDIHRLRQEVQKEYDFSNIIGTSSPMKKLFDRMRKAADTKGTILITGESGTGKELIAKAIHFNSSRRDKAFVVVDCSAIPSNLLESELFGHIKGAFTGADSTKKGLCEEAHQGSLFLDELGELPLELQSKLLRLLQESSIRRIGDTKEIKLDIRVIAATNRNLEEEVKSKRFREDLYYRLNVVPLHAPALRERPEDIPILAAHFLKKYTQEHGRKIQSFSPEVLQVFAEYHWPGNVRQLENCIEQMVIMTEGPQIGIDTLPPSLQSPSSPNIPALTDIPSEEWNLKAVLERVLTVTERNLIQKALEHTNFNKTKAAQLLGISRRSLIYKTQDYGLQAHEKKVLD